MSTPLYKCGCCGTQYLDPARAMECEMMDAQIDAIESAFALNEIPNQVTMGSCECGSDCLGSPKHSVWCPKFQEEK